MLSHHWADRDRLRADFDHLQNLVDRLLAALGPDLGERHGVDNGDRYWRILLGPWLIRMVHTLYDRWAMLDIAGRKHPGIGYVSLIGDADWVVPSDTAAFFGLLARDDYNHHLCDQLARRLPGGPLPIEQPWQGPSDVRRPDEVADRPSSEKLLDLYSRIIGRFQGDGDALVISTFMRWRDEARLAAAFGGVPALWRHVPAVPQTPLDSRFRSWTVGMEPTDAFEEAVVELLPGLMPTAFLEGYVGLLAQVESLPWPRRPSFVFTARAGRDDVLKAYIASKVEQGSKFVVGQHGGYSGIKGWMADEVHEIAISDRFLSWGWTAEGEPSVVPVGSFRHLETEGRDAQNASGMLLVSTSDSRQSYVADSMLQAGQVLEYLEDQFVFMEAVDPVIREEATVRLYPVDHGWNHSSRWSERLPGITLDPGHSDISSSMRACRLFVGTYLGTAFLQTFAMGVPTVLFWQPGMWEVRESAAPYFDRLREVGVFHDSPTSAASHVSNVWSDVEGWWAGSEVAAAVDAFRSRFMARPTDLGERLRRALGEVDEIEVDGQSAAHGYDPGPGDPSQPMGET